uniref:Uncharacterized protein n=1 Tax=Suricata suricatta TaxID=37032 RepID=A0A673UIY9_SURSU
VEREQSGTVSGDPMASWCRKCRQQDPRYLPYTSVRITEAEMRAYHHFLGSCIRLEYMAKQGSSSLAEPLGFSAASLFFLDLLSSDSLSDQDFLFVSSFSLASFQELRNASGAPGWLSRLSG